MKLIIFVFKNARVHITEEFGFYDYIHMSSIYITVSTCLHVVSAQVQYERISEYDDYFFQDFRIFTDKISTLDECLIMCSLNTDGCLSVSHIIEKDLNQQICIGYSVVFQMGSSAIYIDDTMYYAFSKGEYLMNVVVGRFGVLSKVLMQMYEIQLCLQTRQILPLNVWFSITERCGEISFHSFYTPSLTFRQNHTKVTVS